MKCNRCIHYNICLDYRGINRDGDSNSCPYPEERPTGHCIINRMKRFHGTMCDTCTKFQSVWEYRRHATEEEQRGGRE